MSIDGTLTELKAMMEIPDTDEDTELSQCLSAAEAWLESDAGTGRSFSLESGATKVYQPLPDGRVLVKDLITATSIKIDTTGDRTYATTLPSTDYQLWPLIGSRYQEIRIWPTSSKSFDSRRLVQVVGNFGYVDSGNVSPAPMKKAKLLLAARLYKRREAPFGILQAADLGTYTRLSAQDPDVMTLIAPYRLSREWVVV